MRVLVLLCLLVITGVTVVPTSAETSQLKLSKCSQSSTYKNEERNSCNKAIDGNMNQTKVDRSCTVTNWENAWWKASTEKMAQIREIKIHNGGDCCANRNDFIITVDDEDCNLQHFSTDYHFDAFSVKTFQCHKVGQVVMIKSQMRTIMVLCEVQVFGELLSELQIPKQLKLSKCSQSSTYKNEERYSCSKAMDGNADQTCTQTNWENSWWKASTELKAHIKEVKIYLGSFPQFIITVDGEECASFTRSKFSIHTLLDNSFRAKTFKCEKVGHVVMIKTLYHFLLELCEVQVYGELLSDPPEHYLKLLAIGCFKDAAKRDLPTQIENSTTMTVEKCLKLCQLKEFQFAGLQDGTECWCGQGFGRHGKATDDKCNIKCSGDDTQMCGANWHNSIYATSKLDLEQLAIGCFKDSSNRDLQMRVEYSKTTMTVEKCLRLCQIQEFKFAGLQAGTECWCGFGFGRHGKATDDKCNIKCTGDDTKMCGGFGHNSIYATSKATMNQL